MAGLVRTKTSLHHLSEGIQYIFLHVPGWLCPLPRGPHPLPLHCDKSVYGRLDRDVVINYKALWCV
jgi:hypothetical protein